MDVFAEKLNNLLVEIFRLVLKFEEESIKKNGRHNLTISEYHLIECIGDDDKGKTISDVAQEQGVTMSTVTVAINKLLEKGYVRKVKSREDGRVTYVSLTRSGKCARKGHSEFHRLMVERMTEDLTDEEREVLLGCMYKLKNFFMLEEK